MRSPCTDAAIAELRAAGVYDYELVRGGKHWQVQWARKDGARRFVCAAGDAVGLAISAQRAS